METFDLPVVYRDVEHSFPAELHAYGYSYKIRVTVGERAFFFERDEERLWRAVLAEDAGHSKADVDLLSQIAITLDQLLS
jgi:hypothetical protein